jgi:hypothetical protein
VRAEGIPLRFSSRKNALVYFCQVRMSVMNHWKPNATQDAITILEPPQAATYLGLAPQTLAVWRSRGRYALPFIKVGGRVRYRLSDLNRWLEERTQTSGATS